MTEKKQEIERNSQNYREIEPHILKLLKIEGFYELFCRYKNSDCHTLSISIG